MKSKACEKCQQNECCPCPDCKEIKAPRCKELEHRVGLKKWIFWFILIFVLIGFLGPFVAQCILPFIFPDVQIDGITMWNQYVGIVLGVVATILSIVSLVMGFYSSSEASEQQRKAFEQYEATIELIHKVESDVAVVKNHVSSRTRVESIKPVNSTETKITETEID